MDDVQVLKLSMNAFQAEFKLISRPESFAVHTYMCLECISWKMKPWKYWTPNAEKSQSIVRKPYNGLIIKKYRMVLPLNKPRIFFFYVGFDTSVVGAAEEIP